MLILLPVCRNLLSFLRLSCKCLRRNIRRQIDNAISFHILNAYMICFLSVVHYIAHTVNLERMIAAHNPSPNNTDAQLLTTLSNLPTLVNPVTSSKTSPLIEVWKLTAGWTGVIITVSLILILSSATEFIRRSYYEVFWYTHHLFVVFFIFLVIHGIGGIVRTQSNLKEHDPHYCSSRVKDWGKIPECPFPVFSKGSAGTWYWVIGPFGIYIIERLIRYVRSHQKVEIIKVTPLPSKVFEIQMRKSNFKMEPGQYIFIQCSAISRLEWHPFTLTSCSHDDFFSVHIRTAGDWTGQLYKVLDVDGTLANNTDYTLPLLAVDGPYGTASEDIFRYQVDILVGAGIGITPFASVLKEIRYRFQNPKYSMKLEKIYFYWICPEMKAFEWFQTLLKDMERQLAASTNHQDFLEYNIYLSRGWDTTQAQHIFNHEEDPYDVITGLRQKTYFGRPNWEEVFTNVKAKHPGISVGVFLCGPETLSRELAAQSNKHTSTDLRQTRFFFNKEHF